MPDFESQIEQGFTLVLGELIIHLEGKMEDGGPRVLGLGHLNIDRLRQFFSAGFVAGSSWRGETPCTRRHSAVP